MGRILRILAACCLGLAAISPTACSRDATTTLPLEVRATVTQVIPFDTASSAGGEAEVDTVTASGESHKCPPDEAPADPEDVELDADVPPVPPCSDDPVIQ